MRNQIVTSLHFRISYLDLKFFFVLLFLLISLSISTKSVHSLVNCVECEDTCLQAKLFTGCSGEANTCSTCCGPPSCSKSCGAACESDADCSNGCDTSTCTCNQPSCSGNFEIPPPDCCFGLGPWGDSNGIGHCCPWGEVPQRPDGYCHYDCDQPPNDWWDGSSCYNPNCQDVEGQPPNPLAPGNGCCTNVPNICADTFCHATCCVSNQGASCGSGCGTVNCDGTCSTAPPANLGASCGPSGTIQCDSTCNGPCSPNPAPANYNQPCGSCGGRIKCDGTCSISTPINYGQVCGPSGTIQCDSTCNGPCSPNPAPANYNQSCSICGLTDCAGNCTSQTAQVTRDCRQLTKQQFKDFYLISEDELNQLASNTSQFQNLINSATGKDPRKIIHDKCFKENNASACLIMSKKITTTVSSNNNFYSCFNKPGDTACCQNASSCVWNFVCYPDGHKEDFDGDGIAERCLAHSPGQWIPDFETDCTNGIDDDLDGLTDCADPDCAGTVNGTVLDQNSQPISLADINVKQDLTTVSSATTAQDGTYAVGVNCGTYNVVASDPKHAPQIKTSIPVPPRGQAFLNFSLLLGTSCQGDCTYISDNLVHAGCDGINGCSFYDSTAKSACDLSQPGWIRDYNSSHYITCASGSPKEKLQLQASLSCSSGTIVKITRIVTYNGKPVKLIVAVCG